eukprot:TRINITY_DN20065_c0_g2_i4.p1 TRINITY_DN20065_c0_g2~~TRINITY_DN20065_c0_g2_i4.p1  ORF type:complete len:323 (+),score=79.83 TRINITY_DN20065_c0_g2_i4:937-1905(+)
MPAGTFHRVYTSFMRPRMTQNLSQCAEEPATEEEENTLVVTYRGGDVVRGTAPCSMADLIADENGFSHIKVVSTIVMPTNPRDSEKVIEKKLHPADKSNAGAARHPCIDYHVKTGATWAARTLFQDACDILRARHLVVAWSTFPESMALMSTRLVNFYHSGGYTPFGGQGIDFCTDKDKHVWEGAKLFEYDFGQDWKQAVQVHGLQRAMLDYPAFKVRHGPTKQCSWLKVAARQPLYLTQEGVQRKMDAYITTLKNMADKSLMSLTQRELEVQRAEAAVEAAARDIAAVGVEISVLERRLHAAKATVEDIRDSLVENTTTKS